LRYSIQWSRSLIFNIQMYLALALTAVVFLPWMIASKKGALGAIKFYSRYVLWTASWIIDLKTEIRGEIPQSSVIIAAKHQSFLDILMIYSVIPNGYFIMKRGLLYIPLFGQYAYRLGCIPVSRGKRGRAIFQMLKDVEKRKVTGGQLVIYPQGTRVAPGSKKPYKIGVTLIYERLSLVCIPVSTNAGLFWPRRGIYRSSGKAIIEFLKPIPPNLDKNKFLSCLEEAIEFSSEGLMTEAENFKS